MSLYWFITFIAVMKMTCKLHVNVLATYSCNPSGTKWNNSDLNQKQFRVSYFSFFSWLLKNQKSAELATFYAYIHVAW